MEQVSTTVDLLDKSPGLSNAMFQTLGVQGTMDRLRDTRNNSTPLFEATEEGEPTDSISVQYAELEDGCIDLDQFFHSPIKNVSLVMRVIVPDTMDDDTQRELTFAITPQGRICIEFADEQTLDFLPGEVLPIIADNDGYVLKKGSVIGPINSQHFTEGKRKWDLIPLLGTNCEVTDIAIAQGAPEKAVDALRHRFGDLESFRSKELQQHVDSRRLEFLRHTDPNLWGEIERRRKANDHSRDPIYYMNATGDRMTSNGHLLDTTLNQIGIAYPLSSIQFTGHWPAQWRDVATEPYLVRPPEVQYRRVEGIDLDTFLQDGDPKVSLVISAYKKMDADASDSKVPPNLITLSIGRDGEVLQSVYGHWNGYSDHLVEEEQSIEQDGVEKKVYIGDQLEKILVGRKTDEQRQLLELERYNITDMAVVDSTSEEALYAMTYFEDEPTFRYL
jgi:hypothetical protein